MLILKLNPFTRVLRSEANDAGYDLGAIAELGIPVPDSVKRQVQTNEDQPSQPTNEPEPQPTNEPEPEPSGDEPSAEPEPSGDEPEPDPEPTPEPSIEDQMREHGWTSKEEWIAQGKDADDWVSAKQFEARHKLTTKLRDTEKEAKATKSQLDLVQQVVLDMAEQNHGTKMAELEAKRQAAIVDGDIDAVTEIEQQQQELRESKLKLEVNNEPEEPTPAQDPQDPAAPQIAPAAQKYIEDNPWMDKSNPAYDPVAAAEATRLWGQAKQADPSASPEAIIASLDRTMRANFNHLYSNPQRKRPAKVVTPAKPAATNSPQPTAHYNDLDAAGQQMYNFIKKNKGADAAKQFLQNSVKVK